MRSLPSGFMPCLFYLLFPSWLHYYLLAWYWSSSLLCLLFASLSAYWSRHALHWFPFSLPRQDTLPKQLKEGMKEDGGKEEGRKGFCGSPFEGIQPVTTQGTNGGGDWLVTLCPWSRSRRVEYLVFNWLSLFPLFISPGSWPTRWCHHIQGRPHTSVTLLWRLPHRHTQDCIS